MPNLVKTQDGWRVSYISNGEVKHNNYKAIEPAAEFLNSQGISHDAIDEALIEMIAYNEARALFTSKGEFSHLEPS